MGLPKGTIVVCPHCDEHMEYENKVEDFCVPNEYNKKSESPEQCCACDNWFTVTRNEDNTYSIRKVK